MKLAMAILCSLALAMMPLFAAHAPASVCNAAHPRPCCKHCTMACCAKNSAVPSQPVPAPAPNGNQIQLSLLAPCALVLTLPEISAASAFAISPSLSTASAAPIFVRNCAFLI